jgi:pimeloyl-ACP methyl ester carboxylesterase
VIAELGDEFRVLCPDLRGFGWSGSPADGDFRKARVADDLVALLDVLGLEQVRLVGHDWGGWAAIVAGIQAPTRFSSVLAMSVGHPWAPPAVGLKHGWRLGYQLPLAAPFAGERLVRDGHYPRAMLIKGRADGRRWTDEELETYLGVLRDPDVARASSKLYRAFLTRELIDRTYVRSRFAMPAKLLMGDREPFRAFAAGFKGEVEVIAGAGHFLPEEAPAAVAERIRAM